MKNEKIMKKKEVCFLPSLLPPTYLPTYLKVLYLSTLPKCTLAAFIFPPSRKEKKNQLLADKTPLESRN